MATTINGRPLMHGTLWSLPGLYSDTWSFQDALASTSIVQASGGEAHSLALSSEGAIFSWGTAANGRLGSGDEAADDSTPRRIESDERFVSVACGHQHSAAVTADGRVFTWGKSSAGQLGHEVEYNQPFVDCWVPTQVLGLKAVEVLHISCGEEHTSALTKAGTLYTWGTSRFGQLGHGVGIDVDAPKRVKGISAIRSLAGGKNHSIAITRTGECYSWGLGVDGQLGHGKPTNKFSPTRIETVADQVMVGAAAGELHSLLLSSIGDVFTFGDGALGCLGHGILDSELTPRKVDKLDPAELTISSVGCGYGYSVALMDNGAVWAWGTGDKAIKESADLLKIHPEALPSQLVTETGMNGRRVVALSCGPQSSFAIAEKATLLDENLVLHSQIRHLSGSLLDTEAAEANLLTKKQALSAEVLAATEWISAQRAVLHAKLKEEMAACERELTEQSKIKNNLDQAAGRRDELSARMRNARILQARSFQLLAVQWARTSLRHAWQAFIEEMDGPRRLLANGHRRNQRESLRLSKLQGYTKRMAICTVTGQQPLRLFWVWQQVVAQRVAYRGLMGGMLMLLTAVRRANFWRWYRHSHPPADPRMLYHLRKWKNKYLVAVMNSWKDMVTAAQRERRLLRGAAVRWVKRQLSMGWNQWREQYNQQKRLLALLRKGAMRMLKIKLGQALNTWVSWYKQLEWQLYCLRRAMLRWLKREMARAFETWCEWLRARRESRNMINKSLKRWKHRQLWSGLNTWLGWYEDLMRQRKILKNVAGKWRNRRLAMAWNSWTDYLTNKKRQWAALNNAFRRWLMRHLSRAFQSWVEHVRQLKSQRNILSKALARWRLREIAKAYLTWESWYQERMRQARLLRGGLVRMLKIKLGQALNSWKAWYAQLQWQLCCLKKAGMRWLKRKLAMGWHSWRCWLQERRDAAALVGRAIRRWQKRALWSGLNRWMEWYEDLLEQRRVAGIALKKWKLREVLKGLNQWAAWLDERRRQQKLLARAARRIKFFRESRGFFAWLDMVEEARYQRLMVDPGRLLADKSMGYRAESREIEGKVAALGPLLAQIKADRIAAEAKATELQHQVAVAAKQNDGLRISLDFQQRWLNEEQARLDQGSFIKAMYLAMVHKRITQGFAKKAFWSWHYQQRSEVKDESMDPLAGLLNKLHTRETNLLRNVLLRPVV